MPRPCHQHSNTALMKHGKKKLEVQSAKFKVESVFALKGQGNLAQGNALGNVAS
jgi:hypothetical protein